MYHDVIMDVFEAAQRVTLLKAYTREWHQAMDDMYLAVTEAGKAMTQLRIEIDELETNVASK